MKKKEIEEKEMIEEAKFEEWLNSLHYFELTRGR